MARFVIVHGRNGRTIADHEVRAISGPLTGDVEVVRPRRDLVVVLERNAIWERVVPGQREDIPGSALLASSAASLQPSLPSPKGLMGDDFAGSLAHLDGSFVALAWDDHRCRISTDRLGLRAAWCSERPGQVVVASEPHLVLAHPEVPVTPNLGVLAERLSYRPSSPDRTVFEGLELLPAGTTLELSRGAPACSRRWFDWDLSIDRGPTIDEWSELILETTQSVVRREVLSRRPDRSALHVSGGLDSSALAGVVGDVGIGKGMVALTRSYPGLPCDESAFQDAVLRRRDFERRSTPPLPVDVDVDLVEPTNASRLPLLRIEPAERSDTAWLAASSRRTEFTGVGGDELFDAINTTPLELFADRQFKEAMSGMRGRSTREWLRRHRDFFPARMRQARTPIRPWIPASFAEQVRLARRLTGPRESVRVADRPQQRLDWATGGPWRAIRAESTERHLSTRGTEFVPLFLDPELVTLGLRIPDGLRATSDDSRFLQRRAFRSVLPPELVSRRGKVHFDPRHANDLFDPAIESIAKDLTLARSGLVDQQAFVDSYQSLRRAVAIDISAIPALAGPLWSVLGCELWWRSEFA